MSDDMRSYSGRRVTRVAALRARRRKGLARRLLVFLLAGALVAVASTTAMAYAVDHVDAGKVLPGVTVAGVDVGGMRPSQALAAVRAKLAAQLSRPLVLRAGGQTLSVVPARLGVRADVADAVRQALASSQATTWLSRAYHRLFGWPVQTAVRVSYSYPVTEIKDLLTGLAAGLDRAPRDASLQASADDMSISFVRARAGHSLDQRRALALVLKALRHQATTLRLPLTTTPPRVSNAQLGKTITVDLTTNTLRLFDGAHVERTYPVATAIEPYSTPIGTWHVVGKDPHPVWINPGTAWAASMPQMIPPGPANPLGLRALPLNAPGILIHGTPEDYSIGHWASHGCIRMHETDVIALYPLVPVGTKVVIYGAPPWGASAVAGASVGF